MLFGRRFYIDTFAEVYELLKDWADHEFWDFSAVDIEPGAVYMVGREQTKTNRNKFVSMLDDCIMIVSNPHEGSRTLALQMQSLDFVPALMAKKMLLIGGGDMPLEWPCLRYDSFLARIMDYEKNMHAMSATDQIFCKKDKPFSFLCLNGTGRPHRRDLLTQLGARGLLDHALWSNLDRSNGELRFLPHEYEIVEYRNNTDLDYSSVTFAKPQLFDHQWGEIYIDPPMYTDTYFSVVTETVFDYGHSFRTEKIAKPLAMGHPWIAVANRHFYRDLRDLGFRTFHGIIDEGFDDIDNSKDRLSRIVDVIDDLCGQDLHAFLMNCRDICKYNQQHLLELGPRLRKEFSGRFFNFILAHGRS
jgi:hypothetical protein